jgi:hypothetical protein
MSFPLQLTDYVCRNCGWTDFRPVNCCPRCNGDITQSAIAGEGKVVTYTAIRYPPKGFENQAPYVVAIIDIDKGPRIIGRISNSADEVKIGSTVSLISSKEGALEFQLSS